MSLSEPGVPWQWSGHFGWMRRCLGDAVVIHLAGDLDIAAGSALQKVLTAALSDAYPKVCLDLSNLEFVDCYGIGLIVAGWKAANERGRSLTVDGVHGMTESLFWVLGLQPLLAKPAEGRIGEFDGHEYRHTRTAS